MTHSQIPETIRLRAQELVTQMTLEEKATLTIGRDFWTTHPIERLGIPSIWLADGPHGVRKAPKSDEVGLGNSLPATCFPTASALASTWNVALVEEIGAALGQESQAQGVQILLGPGVNLKRSPLGGRNFEYFSEDPVLSGEMAAALINGVQAQGVGTSLKHYAANEQETNRMVVDSVVDERTLRELYLRPFEIAVTQSRPWTLMAAYNRVNGSFATEHPFLLDQVLRQEWGFEGIVMSDWGAVVDHPAAIQAKMHLQMPGVPTADALAAAVRSGRIDEARLDEVVGELLAVILMADANRRSDIPLDVDAHHRLARRAAGESIVLLKNEGGLLPLTAKRIAVIGTFAKTPRYQGSGSSQVNPTRMENAYEELLKLVDDSAEVVYAVGYEGDATDQARLDEAQRVAQRAEVALVFVGLPSAYEAEGWDRQHLDLPPAYNALVEAVLSVQPNTVVVLTNGTAVSMPWAERVPAIVEGWLTGQAGGGAVVDVLLGRVNPSGKLSETFPMRLADTPAYPDFPALGRAAVYGEGLFIGYRWYDTRGIAPLFPFGHGLSYTTFAYSDLQVDATGWAADKSITIALTVRNSGQFAGQEVVQLYIADRTPGRRGPDKSLAAFTKVALQPGEAQTIHFTLSGRDFATFDELRRAWTIPGGDYDILLAASSRDLRLQQRVQLQAAAALPLILDSYSTLREWLEHPQGRALIQPLLAEQLFMRRGSAAPDPEADRLLEGFILNMPLVKLATRGIVSRETLDALLAAVNG